MPLQKTDGLILRSIPLGETSKILTIYSKDFGKISVIAKGARSARSRYGGTLETLNHVSVIFYYKESRDLHTLSQAEIIDSYLVIKEDLHRTALAMAICELTNQLEVGQEANPLLFRLLLSAFKTLDDAERQPINVFRAFQIHVFDLMGFRPNFFDCTGCGKKIETTCSFDLMAGGFACDNCLDQGTASMHLYKETIQMLRALQKTHISKLQPSTESSSSVRQVDEFVRVYLRYHVDGIRDLKALRFYDEID